MAIEAHDQIIILGDLNFRLADDLSRDKIINFVNSSLFYESKSRDF
jgi:hypothetical protein